MRDARQMNLRPAAAGLSMMALFLTATTPAQAATEPYPKMAPLAQYLSPSQADEIALARSAAPPSISADAEILAFGPKGYVTAVKGKNGFVCIVERPWSNNYDKPDFWNPKVRQPHCFNAPAARSVLPAYLKRTEWVLSGMSREEMLSRTKAAVAAHEIGPPELGSMVYMMSKDTYLADGVGHWYPHLMFLLPRTSGAEWGADLKGSPVFSDSTFLEPLTIFFVPVMRWSDGALADVPSHKAKATATAAKR
jgi:hypothetical protein